MHIADVPVLSLFVIAGIFVFSCSLPARNEADLYGDIPAEKYLTGQFDPVRSRAFAALKSGALYQTSRPQYLRKETISALERMLSDFKQAHPRAEIFVVSSTRNFYSQKGIWERKWKANAGIKESQARARKILEYSSMPGTSRHHWGTDIDFNQLTNGYYNTGPGKIFYDWMRAHAQEYGFCQPYNSGRQGEGYQEERWHWSYLPLSRSFLTAWLALPDSALSGLRFAGSNNLLLRGRKYVENINTSCK